MESLNLDELDEIDLTRGSSIVVVELARARVLRP